MKKDRLKSLGIKQTIQRHWMDRTLQMLLAGMPEPEIRAELDSYLATQRQSGGSGERGQKTYGMAIYILRCWFAPDPDLVGLRDDALSLARDISPDRWLPLHWAVLSASYPFWFNTARQCGRLLNLQNQISQRQVFARLTETYGDRETVLRNARYTIRSFVAWGVLVDSPEKGCYAPSAKIAVKTPAEASLLLEAALMASPGQKAALSQLSGTPGLFPFEMPSVSGAQLAEVNQRLSVMRYGLDEEMLSA